jgi:hypothetical protein
MFSPAYIMFGLIFILQYCSSVCTTANSSALIVGQAITGGEKLISSNSKFALGFFQTGASKSSSNFRLPNWYLGIWFHKIPKFTPVWIANRDKPIAELSFNVSKLILSREGNLAIINHVTKSIIWSTHYARNANQ